MDAKPIGKTVIILGGILLFVLVVVSLDQPGGPVRVIRGRVVGADVVPSDTDPPRQIATIALANGPKVQARVVAPSLVKPGQEVRVNEYSAVMTGRKSYEVIAVEGGT